MSNEVQITAEHWDVTDEVYHADFPNTVSNSELKVFDDSPELFRAIHVDRTVERETTDALEFGQVFHHVMRGGLVKDVAILIPDDALTSNGQRRGKAWDNFVLANPGKTLLLEDEFEAVDNMLKSVQEHPKAGAILKSDGLVEFPLRWTDAETGLRLRCKWDKADRIVISDWKSTTSVHPKKFSKHCYDFGYHAQAAMYREGANEYFRDDRPCVFVAIEKKPAHRCAVFELDEEFLRLGERVHRARLRRFADCLASGQWLSGTAKEIVSLSAPNWAKFDEQWEL